jgi:hypothetical protein
MKLTNIMLGRAHGVIWKFKNRNLHETFVPAFTSTFSLSWYIRVNVRHLLL